MKTESSEDDFQLKIPNFENSGAKGSNRETSRRTGKKKSKKALKKSSATSRRSHENGRDSFENMIIEFDDSLKSLDEITLGEEFDLMREASNADDIHVDLSDRFEESRNSARRPASASNRPSSTPIRAAPRRTFDSNSPSKLRTDENTGKYFIWKKGPNNRYIKVPINGPNETNDGSIHEGSTTSTLSCSNVSSAGVDLDRLEEKLVEEAMNRSLAESLTEDELIELALSRSLQDLSTSGSNLTSDGTDSDGNFVWRKRPNNAYYKCPTTRLGQVNEGDEYGDN